MGFLDSIFGGGGSKTKVKFEQSPQQERLGGAITPFLTQLFKENAWQNLLPTAEIMRSLDPSIRESLWQPVEYGADRLAEQLEARGQTGGSFQTAMGEYYGQAAPGISAQMANLVTPALSAPYNLAAGLYPQTLAYPVVQQGSPSFMQS
ncbi:MAG: hypothetical protein GWN13_29745, partial [Phycisphaerae bacterium]|nr:hypothetical protein [Phycisphaerae bacterium]